MNTRKQHPPAEAQPDPFAMIDANIAYIRRVEVDGKMAYAIHSSDGTMLGVVDDWDTAFATARVYDYEPLAVH